MKSSKFLFSELDSEIHKKQPSLSLPHSYHSSVDQIFNPLNNFNLLSQGIQFNKTIHIILTQLFCPKQDMQIKQTL